MRSHSAFDQEKGSGLVFFRFWGHSRLWPQNQKKVSPDPFHKNMVRKVYTAKISGPYQLFYGSGPIFVCSVNGAKRLENSKTLFIVPYKNDSKLI